VAIAVPASATWLEAGGFPEVFTTAHDALFTQCGLAMGERLLIHGAAGGVGTAAVQLGRSTGAVVTATVRDESLRDAVTSLGAKVIPPDKFSDDGPFDVILELVGAPNLAADVSSLDVGGRLSIIGVGAGSVGELDLRQLMAKRALIRGSTLRARPLEDKADAARRLECHVLPLLEQRQIHVPIAETFRMPDADLAYERFAKGGKLGKIVLTRTA
jgi:NADPH:quinone reductase-like Zn-dependent oxidoreductase